MRSHSTSPAAPSDVRATYDTIASEYTRRIAGELAHKPFDRALLDRFAERVRGAGLVADLGCGPGHVAQYLAGRGVEIVGIDLSPRMVAQARALHPGLRFELGDLTAPTPPASRWAGALAYYSLIHLPPETIPAALRSIARALRPGAPLLVAFHVGDAPRHLEEWWGHRVSIDFQFFAASAMAEFLVVARFAVEAVTERDPYPDVEAPTRRAYILAAAGSSVEDPAPPASRGVAGIEPHTTTARRVLIPDPAIRA